MNDPEVWLYAGTLTAALLAFSGVVWAALVQRTQGNRIEAKADTAAAVAATAAANTKHVSNGFATHTTAGIDQLIAGQDRLQASIDRLAESHGRTVGRLDHAIERLDQHLDPPTHGTRTG